MSSVGMRHPVSLGSVHQHRRPSSGVWKWQRWCLIAATWYGLLLQPASSREGPTKYSAAPEFVVANRRGAEPYRQLHEEKTVRAPRPPRSAPSGAPLPDRTLRSSRQSTSPDLHKRVVLSYTLQGCPSNRNGAEERGQLLQGQEASSYTMQLLRDKLSELLSLKKSKWAEAVPSLSELLGYGQPSESIRVTTELSSRYLSSLQMEVIKTLPAEVSENEVIELAESLPCVEKAYPDGLKYTEEALRGTAENGTPTPLQTVKSTGGSGVSISEELLSGGVETLDSHTWEGPPDDPGFRLQWSLHDSAPYSLHAETLWRVWTGEKRPMVIAVIDSGCDLDHPDLRNRAWNNPGEICGDGLDNDQNGLVDDCHGWNFAEDVPDVSASANGHGTGAAGILGATARNHLGLVGVCWGCEIMCLKFIGKGNGAISNQVQAIDYAVKMGAWISNNSYGGYGFSELEFDAIRRAQLAGHLFITSAGNMNLNTDLPQNDHTPSTYKLSNIVSVGASTYFGKKAVFSNYGLETVHVFAPGADVYTTDGVSGYAKVNGTSFASPHVAGAAGLIWSAFPSLTYSQIKQALIEGCTKSRHLGPFAVCGGTVDVLASFRLCAEAAARTNAVSTGAELRRDSPSSKTVASKDQNVLKTKDLPAREPELVSVLGVGDAAALSKYADVLPRPASEVQDTTVAAEKYAVDSSLGPAISMSAYKGVGRAGSVPGGSYDARATSEVFRRCAGGTSVANGELRKIGVDCTFLSKLHSVPPGVAQEGPSVAGNDAARFINVPSTFSLFNDNLPEHVWRAKAQSP